MFNASFLNDRALISIVGDGSREFLQGLITNDIAKLSRERILYSLMLTPQGKFLYDFFIWEDKDKIFIDCLLEDRDEIIDKLNLYKLGKDIQIKKSDDYEVLFVASVIPGFADPRFPNASSRIYLSNKHKESFLKEHNISLVSEEYNKFLCAHTFPDASYDMIKGRSFPLEYGMDKYNAISFDKGCYVGQELVARTKYRGTIRKKIFRITSSQKMELDKGTEVLVADKVIGVFCSSYNNIGKALLRTDYLEEIQLKSDTTEAIIGGVKVVIA